MTRSRPQPRTVGHFGDCYPVLDLALRTGGIRLPPDRAAKLIAFRHRLYRARSLLLRKAEEAARPGEIPSTPYDTLIIRLEPHTAKGDDEAQLVIEVQAPEADFFSRITDLEGNPIEEETAREELEDAARAARNALGLE